MKLADYLRMHEITPAEFARRIGVQRQHAWRMARGINRPSGRLIAVIERETAGAVTASDFYERDAA